MTQALGSTEIVYQLPLAAPVAVPWRYAAASEHELHYLDATGTVIAQGRFGAQFTIAPNAAAENTGTLMLLSQPAGAVQARLMRATSPTQNYASTPGAEGIEAQLDRTVLILQEVIRTSLASLRVAGASLAPIVPGQGQTIIWRDGAFVAGPSADAIANAQSYANIAQAASAVLASLAASEINRVAQFPNMAAFRAWLEKGDLWATGDIVRVADSFYTKRQTNGGLRWILSGAADAPIQDRFLGKAGGAVLREYLESLPARSLMGNAHTAESGAAALTVQEVLAMLGFRFYGEAISGGVDLPSNTGLPNAPTAFRIGRKVSGSGTTRVDFAAPLQSSIPAVTVTPWVAAGSTENLGWQLVDAPDPNGFSVRIYKHNGDGSMTNVARTFSYCAIGNGA